MVEGSSLSGQQQRIPGDDRRIIFISVNYYCSELIKQMLASLAAQQDGNVHCIVVDNSPYDSGLDDLARRDDVTLLRPGRNLGFGGGCNLAFDHLEQTQSDAIAWLINPDARLLPGAIQQVRGCLQPSSHPPCLLGTRILDSHGSIWFSHGCFDPFWGKVYQDSPRYLDSGSSEQHVQRHRECIEEFTESCDWVSGCSMILDLAVIRLRVRFDSSIFLYYEDTELCLRMAKEGVPSRVIKQLLVSHSVSATMTHLPIGRYRHAAFGKLYLLHRHATPLAVLINVVRFFFVAVLLVFRDPAQSIGKTVGVLAYFRWLVMRSA